ncbi:MAG: ABC transporter ATP-binding protein [Flavobacteriaceae bacterium]|nr:ABC transporter ATP-binding protein [Flavobacteriaceae bacterium]
MIKISNLSYQYTRRQTILDQLDLEMHSGKIYGLLGKNGAGKSTFIKNIAGMLFPSSGSCIVLDKAAKKREVAFLKEMFYVPEIYYLPNLRIQQLEDLYHGFYPNFCSSQFAAYLETFGISHQKRTTALSLGQKKKVLIGFALAANTKVLILDEPTNGLDIPSKITFRNMILEAFGKDRIVLISSHQVRDLEELIDHIVIMDKGKIRLNQSKKAIAQKWSFSLTDHALPNEAVLYQQKMSNSFGSIQINQNQGMGHVDMELLFNAVLSKKIKTNI